MTLRSAGPAAGEDSRRPWLRGFRAKFVLVVGGAVTFDLVVAGGLALWNLNAFSRDAEAELEAGLTRASTEYLANFIETTATRVDVALDHIDAEVTVLARTMQRLIERPGTAQALAGALASDPVFAPPLAIDPKAGWAQNGPGAASVVSVWGYLMKDDALLPEARQEVERSAIFDLFAPEVLSAGAKKLQLYYVGPKSAPVMRTTPYTQQAQTFDRLYPGHNSANFWDFFFPGVWEGWQAWISAPDSQPVRETQVTATAPYIDAITGAQIVSFFHPLWTLGRRDVAGMAAVDVTLDQLAGIVEGVRIAESGFAFLALSDGNLLAVTAAGEQVLGLGKLTKIEGTGVTGLDRRLGRSDESDIAALEVPEADAPQFMRVFLGPLDEPHIVVLRRLSARNFWEPEGVRAERPLLGFIVPESELFSSLTSAQVQISEAKDRIVLQQGIVLAVSLFVVLTAVFGLSGRITAGLSDLAMATRRLRGRDYSIRIAVRGSDEIGEVGAAFNRMAEDMQRYTSDLEGLVAERNIEILDLNAQLRSENLRLTAEIDVARQVQMMVLPRDEELGDVPGWDIACHMQPADEVGGDYYDILCMGDRVKIGIGDVTGHGLHSGVVMLMVQSLVRGLMEAGEHDPRRFLSVLNRSLTKNIQRSGSDKHMTIAFVDIGPDGVVLSGQHEEVIILRRDGNQDRIDTMDLGFPLGLAPEIGDYIEVCPLEIAEGEALLLYTDGITEAENAKGEFYGISRLAAAAATAPMTSARVLRDTVLADLQAFIGSARIHDDITLVVLRRRESGT